MRTMISTAVLGSFLALTAATAFAQTTPAPSGASDCKAGEMFDATLKTCTKSTK